MLDIKFIRENPERVKNAVRDKKLDKVVDIDKLIVFESEYRDLLRLVEEKRGLRNQLSENISKVDGTTREKLISEASEVKNELSELEVELKVKKEHLDKMLQQVPNIIAEDVPVGLNEDENVVIREWGEPKKHTFSVKDHIELGAELDIIDTDTSAKVSGARFAYIKNEAALMQMALVSFVFETLTDTKIVEKLAKSVGNKHFNPFVPVIPPVMIKFDVMQKMDRLEPKEERYVFEEDSLALVGSAEHTMGPMHMDQVMDVKDLPKRYIGYSTAFRREAGSYGKDTKGIIRVHQFDKLEMETFSLPEDGGKEQELMVAIQEYFCQQLEIPHQVLMICTGDMGKPDYKQMDINCWIPSQGTYRETHTSDYMTDYQARRLNIKSSDGRFVHMNDATAIAIGRMLVAIIENYQQKNGSVEVPEVLQKYMGGIKKITKK